MDSKINIILEVLGDSIDKHGYLSGSSTMVPPISHWVKRRTIEVLLSYGITKKDIEEKADQITARCGFDSWIYINNHGDCPNEIRFYE